MGRRYLVFAYVALFLFINIAPMACAEPSPVVLPQQVTNVTLRLFYDAGAIHGYVIFRDYKSQMCAVKFLEPAVLIIYDKKGNQLWKKNLGLIDVDKNFKLLTLKNQDVILAYEIEPFVFNLEKDEEVTMFFEWGNLKASDKVSNFLGD